MKKLFTAAIVFIFFLIIKEADAQTLQNAPTDSSTIESVESERWRDTSFHCSFGSNV